MTSDLIQHQQANKMPIPAPFLNLPHKRAGDKDIWRKSLGAVLTVLNKAQIMIERAEQKLLRQDARIAELENLTTIDHLTGLLNRRGFFQAFVREIARVERDLEDGGLLVLVDVDNFSTVNRLYGEEAGDTCLRLVRHTLKSDIRAMDIVARLGADEFVLLLASTTKEKAAARVQKLAMKLNNLSFIWHGAEICISASIGMKSYGSGDAAETIFKAADRDLSRIKEKRKISSAA